MKIYTKTGDDGSTALFGGSRILKSAPRVEAYGNIDELNSFIGLLISYIKEEAIRKDLTNIQHILFNIGSIFATIDERYKEKLPKVEDQYILTLENKMDEMEASLKPMTHFILPGGSQEVSLTHICRTVCRRVERSVVRDSEMTEDIDIQQSLKFLNRLSDYFFVLARYLTQLNNTNEVIWKKEIIF